MREPHRHARRLSGGCGELAAAQLDNGTLYSEETISGTVLEKNVSVPSLKNNSFSSLEL